MVHLSQSISPSSLFLLYLTFCFFLNLLLLASVFCPPSILRLFTSLIHLLFVCVCVCVCVFYCAR